MARNLRQGRNLEAGTEVEAMEERCLLVQPAFLHHPRTSYPRVASLTMEWVIIILIINQENGCLQANLVGAFFFSIDLLLSPQI